MKQKGITLIALVITIIVLVILAGVTLSMVMGENGILTNAISSKQLSEQAQIAEKVKLAAQSAKIKALGLVDYNTLIQELNETFGEGNYEIVENEDGWIVTIDGVIIEITKFGETHTSSEDSDSGEKSIVLKFLEVEKKNKGAILCVYPEVIGFSYEDYAREYLAQHSDSEVTQVLLDGVKNELMAELTPEEFDAYFPNGFTIAAVAQLLGIENLSEDIQTIRDAYNAGIFAEDDLGNYEDTVIALDMVDPYGYKTKYGIINITCNGQSQEFNNVDGDKEFVYFSIEENAEYSVQATCAGIVVNERVTISKCTTENENNNTQGITGKYYDDDTNIKLSGKNVKVPAGFTISGLSNENSIDDGLVIYNIPKGTTIDWTNETEVIAAQKTYDQFVWVPVKDIVLSDIDKDGEVDETDLDIMICAEKYPMVVKNNNGNYRQVAYNIQESENVDSNGKKYVKVNRFLDLDWADPVYLQNTQHGDASAFNNVGITESGLISDYNKMVENIVKNEGFWVGRYETSNMVANCTQDNTNRVTIIKDTQKGISDSKYITDGSGLNWYRMYAQQKNYTTVAALDTNMTSSMIWGSQWEQIMFWMIDINNESQNSKYIVNSVGMGNYTGTIRETGFYAVKNIYDLAGNVADWTLSGNCSSDYANNNYRNTYGGDCDTGMTWAAMGSYVGAPNISSDSYGSRMVIY